MALRQHRLPRFWLAITLGSVVVAVGGVYWWERQLPCRIERAAATGQLDDCLRFGEQLAALSWRPGGSTQEQARCQRLRAEQLWRAQHWDQALTLQRRLVHSSAGVEGDRRRLSLWQDSLRRKAMAQFQAGDLNAALAALTPIGEEPRGDGNTLGDELTENWNRNRVQLQRAEQLTAQARWWEALDALNRIDHPWWKTNSKQLRQQVQQGIASLRRQEDKEHEGHGETNPSNVSIAELDALISRKIAAGMDDGQAFERACRDLGGKVVETGPESACRR